MFVLGPRASDFSASNVHRPSALTKTKISPQDCNRLLKSNTNGRKNTVENGQVRNGAKENFSAAVSSAESSASISLSLLPAKKEKHPSVTWYQSEIEIIFNVLVPDLKGPSIELSKRNVKFHSQCGYSFEICLFGIADSYEEFLTGQYYRVKFLKRIQRRWPRVLFEDGLKLPWLKKDMNHVDDEGSDEEDSNSKFVDLQQVNFDEYQDRNIESDSDSDNDGFEELD